MSEEMGARLLAQLQALNATIDDGIAATIDETLLAKEATLGDVKTAAQAGATQTTLAAVLTKLSADPATQTTLAALSAKVPALGAAAAAASTPVVLTAPVPRVAHRASAALPAAGAWTATGDATPTPVYTVPAGITSVTFAITYTRGAAGGYPYLQAFLTNGTESVKLPLVYHPDLVPTGAGAVVGVYTVAIPPGMTTIQLLAREMGVIATPGTLAIGLVAGSGGIIPESIRACVVDFSCSTPSSATTALGTSSFDLGFLDLSNFENFKMSATLATTDGTPLAGTLITTLHTTIDGVNWSEWLRYPTIANNTAAVNYITTFALDTLNTAVGKGVGTATITEVIAAPAAGLVTSVGGHVGRGIRVQFTTGAGTNHAVAQTFRLVGTRKVVGY
jgi:hypothetical protein